MSSLARMLGLNSIHCFAHQLQLVVNDLVNSVADWPGTSNSVRKICKFLNKSKIAREKYVEGLEFHDLPMKMLSKDTPVRWSSTYHMCERFVASRSGIEFLLVAYKKELPQLTEGDWDKLELMKKVLAPFNSVTKIIQHPIIAPVSVIIPFVRLLEMTSSANKAYCKYSQILYEPIAVRFDSYLKLEELQIATVLDPRFKLNFLLDDHVNIVQGRLAKLVYNLMSSENSTTPLRVNSQEIRIALNENNNDDMYDLYLATHGARIIDSPDLPESEVQAKANHEVRKYLSEAADISIEPFEYWQQNKTPNRFPTLAVLARRYLSIPSTSAESERLFSSAGLILTDYRKRMSPETLQQLLFLKVNSTIFSTPRSASADSVLEDT